MRNRSIVLILSFLFFGLYLLPQAKAVHPTASKNYNQVLVFKNYAELNQTEKHIADIVYVWSKKAAKIPAKASGDQLSQNFVLPKERISITFTDLNQDQKLDAIAVPGSIWCGTGGCSLYAFIAPNFYSIPIGTAFLSLPVKITNQSTDGFSDIRLNNQTHCQFVRKKNEYACNR